MEGLCFICGTNKADAILLMPPPIDSPDELSKLFQKYIYNRPFPTCFQCTNPNMDCDVLIGVLLAYAEKQAQEVRQLVERN